MNHLKIVFALFFFVLFVRSAEANINVGVAKLELKDEQRLAWDGKSKRPIITHVFYPTYDEFVDQIKLGEPGEELFVAGTAKWDAKPVDKERLPLIIMSHGTGGSALQMLWLAEKLVKNGYLVVGVNHHGNTAIEARKYAEGFILWWERAKDLAVVLQQLNNDKTWSPYINQNNVGVIGFSLGGYTAISSIGGITDKSLFAKFCTSSQRDFTCEDQVEFSDIEAEFNKVKDSEIVKASLQRQHNSYKIDQIKAALVLSPAVAQSFTRESLKGVNIPVSVFVGTNDKVAPATSNAKRIASLIKGAVYSEIENAGHYTFLSNCTDLGKKYLQELCSDSPKVDRGEIHVEVSNQAVKFFNSEFDYNNALQRTSR